MPRTSRSNATNIEERVLVLEQEAAVLQNVIEKLDTTIGKLTDAIGSLKEIIVNQELRIKQNEDGQSALKEAVAGSIGEAKSREKDFKEDVVEKIEKQDARIKFLERWLWIMTGGGIAASWLLQQINFDVRIGQ